MAIPPPPLKTPMVGLDGKITMPWAAWAREVTTGGTATVESVASHVADTTAHAASSITNSPSGNVSSTNVQAAINELQGSIDALGAFEGDSAYEVAVANGFVGDEDAWLLSLIGDTGPTGATGSTGPQGATGVQGPEGPPGGDINTSFAVSSLEGFIYTSAIDGSAYLLEFT